MRRIVVFFVCLALLFVLVSCNHGNLSKDDVAFGANESVKVQQISCGTSYQSQFRFETTMEKVSALEYEKAENKAYGFSGTFRVDGTTYCQSKEFDKLTPEELNEFVGKVYYSSSGYSYEYYKVTIQAVHVSIVEVLFLDDGTLGISYYDFEEDMIVTKRVKTENYSVTFFNQDK